MKRSAANSTEFFAAGRPLQVVSVSDLRKLRHTGPRDPMHGLIAGPAATSSRLSGVNGLFMFFGSHVNGRTMLTVELKWKLSLTVVKSNLQPISTVSCAAGSPNKKL